MNIFTKLVAFFIVISITPITHADSTDIEHGDEIYLKTHTGKHIDVEGINVQARWNAQANWQKLIIERKNGTGAIKNGDEIYLKAHTGKHIDVEGINVQARWNDQANWQKLIIEDRDNQKSSTPSLMGEDTAQLEADPHSVGYNDGIIIKSGVHVFRMSVRCSEAIPENMLDKKINRPFKNCVINEAEKKDWYYVCNGDIDMCPHNYVLSCVNRYKFVPPKLKDDQSECRFYEDTLCTHYKDDPYYPDMHMCNQDEGIGKPP